MEQDNPYAAPQVELIEAQASRPLAGWGAVQLRVLGWLSLVYLLATLVVLGLTAAPELGWLSDWLSLASTLLGCYLALRLKAFVEARFAAAGLAWPVWLSVLLSLALELAQLYWGEVELAGFGVPSMVYLVLLVLLGLVMLWLGIVLLRVANPYPSLRVLAWLNIASGVLVATIILLLVGILPLLAAMIATALVFFRGASEQQAE